MNISYRSPHHSTVLLKAPVKHTRLCSVCKRINSRPSPDRVSGQLHVEEPGTDSQPLLFHQRFFVPVPLAQLAWDGNRWGAWVSPCTAQMCGRAAARRKGERELSAPAEADLSPSHPESMGISHCPFRVASQGRWLRPLGCANQDQGEQGDPAWEDLTIMTSVFRCCCSSV